MMEDLVQMTESSIVPAFEKVFMAEIPGLQDNSGGQNADKPQGGWSG